jgi:hypothetical protein
MIPALCGWCVIELISEGWVKLHVEPNCMYWRAPLQDVRKGMILCGHSATLSSASHTMSVASTIRPAPETVKYGPSKEGATVIHRWKMSDEPTWRGVSKSANN